MNNTFGQILIGDMFNTKVARWVKTSETHAICVMSGVFDIGIFKQFSQQESIVLLWSSLLRC